MIRLFSLVCLALALWTAPAFAQFVPPSCPLDTPVQRVIWDRMKAENHVGYQQIIKNTTWDRYNDIGRWEMLAAIVNKDAAMMQRAYTEVKTVLSDFTNVFRGNESREYAIELPVMYACMYPYLDDTQRSAFRDYIVKVGDGIVAINRLGDSDQATGNYLGIALMDKFVGTKYLTGTFFDGVMTKPVGGLAPSDCQLETSMRDAVCYFAKVMSLDGAWPEGTAYNGGTLWLFMTGIKLIGIEFFPEAVPFLKSLPKYLFHEHMPGLRNRFEFGDTEHPNQMILAHGPQDVWQVLQSLLDQIGEKDSAAYVRQFEADMLAANGITVQNPMYSRYYYFHNPYGEKLPWREWAGKAYSARGQGLMFWRTGWSSVDRATWLHTPGTTNGVVDHWGAFEVDMRAFRNGKTVIDHPLGYGPDRRLFNTVMIRDSGISPESGGVVGTAFEDGVLGFASGFNAGIGADVYEGYAIPAPTFQHGQFRYVFQPLDGGVSGPDVWLVIDTVHADDPTTLTGIGWMNSVLQPSDMYSKSILDRFLNAKPLSFYWHTPVKPTITGTSIAWDLGNTKTSISLIYPDAALFDVDSIDEAAAFCSPTNPTPWPSCIGGYVDAGQLKYATKFSYKALPEYSATVHCVKAFETVGGECAVLQSASGAKVIGGSITRPNLPTVSILVSAIKGPKLSTSLFSNGRVRWDHSKGEAVVKSTRVCAPFTFEARGGDVYFADLCDGAWLVEQGGKALQTTRVQSLLKATTAAGLVTVRQSGQDVPVPDPVEPKPVPCTYTLAPVTYSFPAGGGSTTLKITPSAATCAAPVITSSVTWIKPANVSGQWTLTASANTATTSRTGSIAVNGMASMVAMQAGVTAPVPPTCKTVIETILISASASSATWTTQINQKEQQGYTFLDAESGKAFFRKNCPVTGSPLTMGAGNPYDYGTLQRETAARIAQQAKEDAAEVQRLRAERLAIEADLKGKR